MWRDILKVENHKQNLFLDRMFALHALAVSRSSSTTQAVRVPSQQWEKEVNLACVGAYVLEAMKEYRDPAKNNSTVFSDSCLKMCRTRFVEGILNPDFGYHFRFTT